MSEEDVMAAHAGRDPVTVASLVDDLQAIGLASGVTVLAHSSLSRLGWVLGGAQAVITALETVLGEHGTLMMPTHSTQLTDPQYWQNPPVPQHWWSMIREQTPAYNKHLTVTRTMGAIPELFRTQPNVLRSDHPHGSFAARGPLAATLVGDHPLAPEWGDSSPLGKLYEADGHVLLLGVDHGNNTSLHLAETRAELPNKVWIEQGAPMLRDGVQQYVRFTALDFDASDFAELGEDFARDTQSEARGPIGWGEGRFMSQRAVVDYGQQWLEQHRGRQVDP